MFSSSSDVVARKDGEIWSWEHTWRWDYSGWVWVEVIPDPDSVGKDIGLYAQWGPRVRPTICLRVPSEGIVLCTGKGYDKSGRATPISLSSDHPLVVRFGTADDGFPSGKKLYDITGPWKPRSYFEQRKSGPWVEPKGRLDPYAEPLKTPRTW